MHRIDTSTAQKDKFGAGKNGFTRGNPQTGTPATDLDDDYFDMLQEELAGVVEATGVSLDKSKHNQLLTALKALLLSREHPFADIKADGATAVAEALSNLGLGVRGTAVFTSTATWTCPAEVTTVYIDACGGGGGGAYGTLNATGGGGGGGAQAVRRSAINVSPGQTYTITIGLGGVAGVTGAVDGGNGGVTRLGSLISLAGGIGGKNNGTGSAPGGGGGTYGISGNYTSSLSSGGPGGQCIFGSSGPSGNGVQVGQGGG
ncbi:TPA: glycine-rich domain-containing protein, partial [Kluyvera ascorbata]